jgi:hypothetical protein
LYQKKTQLVVSSQEFEFMVTMMESAPRGLDDHQLLLSWELAEKED